MLDLRTVSTYFSAGAVGGLVAAAVCWFLGASGITDHFDVSIKPSFTQDWVYLQVVHGGLWGMLFFLPLLNRMPVVKGLILSIIPTCFVLFVMYPIFLKKGTMGEYLGDLTWAVVVIDRATWGITTGLWLRWTR
jgi:hypothetical protein